MSERTFPDQRIEAGGVTAVAYRIECSSCEAVGFYPQKRLGIRRPPHSIAEHFRGMNWIVGSGPRKDLCPECARRRKPKKEKVMTDTAAATKPQADKPREMTRDDRRIINDKLDEVYGKDCYKAPWTDATVAKDLGVPRDWVAQVRDQFFGPEGSNPLFDEYLSARDAVEAEWLEVKRRYDAAMKAVDELRPAYHAAHQSLEALRLLGRRIEREIGR